MLPAVCAETDVTGRIPRLEYRGVARRHTVNETHMEMSMLIAFTRLRLLFTTFMDSVSAATLLAQTRAQAVSPTVTAFSCRFDNGGPNTL
jgi:hypothetical protein